MAARIPLADTMAGERGRQQRALTGPSGAPGKRPLSGLPDRALNDRHWRIAADPPSGTQLRYLCSDILMMFSLFCHVLPPAPPGAFV